MVCEETGTCDADTFRTSLCVVLVVCFGAILPLELKAFYKRGNGDMKNTVSAIDTMVATVLLAGLRLVVGSPSEANTRRQTLLKLRWAAPPGVFVFLVITLSTWANFLSYWTFAMLGPCELIFVWIFARVFQEEARRLPLCADLPAVLLTALGSLLFSVAEVTGSGDANIGAILASLLCRACQALMVVSLRSCCVALKGQGRRGGTGVLEITAWKLLVTSLLCLPYALITEGLAPWLSLANKDFWVDATSATLFLASIFITIAFQSATVGVNAGLRSPVVAVVLGTLQPLTGVALALAFSGSPFGKALGLKPRDSPLEIAGTCCLVLGLLLAGWAAASRLQAQFPVVQSQSLQFLDHQTART